jgi:hypothetical protein
MVLLVPYDIKVFAEKPPAARSLSPLFVTVVAPSLNALSVFQMRTKNEH